MEAQPLVQTAPPLSHQDPSLEQLESYSAEELVRYAFSRFGERAAIGTSFQHSGLALIDMAKQAGLPFRVFTIDTLRLHPETYQHVKAVEEHFGIEVERYRPDELELKRMVNQHGEYLFFDSPEKRQFCCRIRKDHVSARVVKHLGCWITGLRRDQSSEREKVRKAQIVQKYGPEVLKLSPVADWPEERVLEYVRSRGIPENKLVKQGYRSIGCFICTTPVRASEDARAGRWRWEQRGESKECGLHLEEGAGI